MKKSAQRIKQRIFNDVKKFYQAHYRIDNIKKSIEYVPYAGRVFDENELIALVDALQKLKKDGKIDKVPIQDYIAATSVGILNDTMILDLCYAEDSKAEVDMNVIMTGAEEFIEIQGTAERKPFSKDKLDKMLDLAKKGIQELFVIQRKLVGDILL